MPTFHRITVGMVEERTVKLLKEDKLKRQPMNDKNGQSQPQNNAKKQTVTQRETKSNAVLVMQ